MIHCHSRIRRLARHGSGGKFVRPRMIISAEKHVPDREEGREVSIAMMLAASRIKARIMPHDDDFERELAINPFVNSMLTAVLRAEVRLTLAGLRWPAGGSRVVVARAV